MFGLDIFYERDFIKGDVQRLRLGDGLVFNERLARTAAD